MVTQQYNRFKDAPCFPQRDELVMNGGAGGIGSWFTLFLSKSRFKPTVYDFDRIEEHNTGGQLFRHEDVGSLKVDAVQKIVLDFCGVQVNTVAERINYNSPTHYFMFSAFDNM